MHPSTSQCPYTALLQVTLAPVVGYRQSERTQPRYLKTMVALGCLMAHYHCVRFANQHSNTSCIDPTATGLCPEKKSARIAIATCIQCLWSGFGHCVKANRPSTKQCCPLPLSSQPMDVLRIPCHNPLNAMTWGTIMSVHP